MQRFASPAAVLATVGIAVLALIISVVGVLVSFNVVSERIADHTIKEQDLANRLTAKIKLPDGQVMNAQIILDDNLSSQEQNQVLGALTEQGELRVIVRNNALVVLMSEGSVTTEAILDGSLLPADLAFNVISSVDGVENNGGNVDLVAGNGISITPDDAANTVTFAFTSPVNADLLDGLDSLDFVHVAGDTMVGNLVMNAADIQMIAGDLNLTGGSTITSTDGNVVVNDNLHVTGDLIVDGNSYHTGEEEFYGPIDAQNVIKNDVGDVTVDDNLVVNNDITILGDSFHFGDETFYGMIDAQSFIRNTVGPLLLSDFLVISQVDHQVGDDLTVGDDVTVGDDLTVNSDASIGDDLSVNDDANIGDDLSVGDDLAVGDNFTVADNSTLGTSSTDTLTVNARINSNLVPQTDLTYDLGTAALRWDELFVGDVNADCFNATGGSTYCLDANIAGTLTVAGATNINNTLHATGAVDFDSTFNVDGDSTLNANVALGDANTDNVIFNADVNSNILPDLDLTYDLGSLTQRWDELFVGDVTADCFNATGGSTYCLNAYIAGTLNTVGAVDFDSTLNVDGNTTLNGTLDVLGATFIDDTLNVTGNTDLDANLNVDGNTTLNGDVNLGDATGDNLYFNGRVATSIVPNTNDTYDLGTAALRFQDGFFSDSVRVGAPGDQTRVEPGVIRRAGGDLTISTFNGGGNLILDPQTALTYSDGDFLPMLDLTYDLGSPVLRWDDLYVADVNATCFNTTGGSTYCDSANIVGTLTVAGATNINNTLHATGAVDFDSTFNADGAATLGSTLDVTGDTNLNATLDVLGATFIDDTLNVTGAVDFDTTLNVNGNTDLDAALNVDGNSTLNGNVALGDTAADTVTFNALVASDILPSADLTFDLGSAILRWDELFVGDINADCFNATGGSTYCLNANIAGTLTVAGATNINNTLHATGAVDFDSTLNVDGNSTLNANVSLGDGNTDDIFFNGQVATDIIPDANDTYDLGTGALRFQDGFFSDSVRVGAAGNQTRYENGLINRVGGTLDISTTAGGLLNFNPNGTNILSLADGVAQTASIVFGPYGYTNPAFEATLNGDLHVTGTAVVENDLIVNGTIDPEAIILTPSVDGQTAIQVNDTTGAAVFIVDENGSVTLTDISSNSLSASGAITGGSLEVGGGYAGGSGATIATDGSISTNGDVNVDGALTVNTDSFINAQLSVADLVVSGMATFSGTLDSDLMPDLTNTYDLGSGVARWANLFTSNADVNGNLNIVGTLTIDGVDLESALATLDSRLDAYDLLNLDGRLTTAEGNITAIQALDVTQDGRLTALEARTVVVGGVQGGCAIGVSCPISIVSGGLTIQSVTVSAIGTGNLRPVIDADPAGTNTVNVTVLGGGGAVLNGVSWVATMQ